MQQLPSWVRPFLNDADAEHVRSSVGKAELFTSGEIVPMIVRSSTPTGHVFPLLTAILLVISLGAENLYSAMTLQTIQHPLLFFAGLLVSIILAWVLARSSLVQRVLTSRDDMALQVARRAELEFFEAGLDHTRGGTAVLLMVSLMEHRAVVLADKSISSKLPPEAWQQVVDSMIQGIKSGNPTRGLCDAINLSATLLQPHFPKQDDNINELRDCLRIKD